MRNSYLAMMSDPSYDLISSDFQDIGHATKAMFGHTAKLFLGLSLGSTLLQCLATLAAIYLLVLDQTNWKTNIRTQLVIPYIFYSLPSLLFIFLRGTVGNWIAFIVVILRLLLPKLFPDWLELPVALILLIVAAPSYIANTARDSWFGLVICLGIGFILLLEHIRASGGFRKAFNKSKGVSNSVGIIILMVYPVLALIFDIL